MECGHLHLLWLFSTCTVFTLRLATGQDSARPQFLTQPSNQTAYQSTTLPCTASGSPAPTISWHKDGSPLDVGADSRLTLVPQGLGVSGLQDEDGDRLEGVYWCLASNQLGTVRSRPATLTRTVWDVPSLADSTETVLRYTHVALTCVTPGQSVPPATVTWQPVNPPNVTTALDGRLLVSYVDLRRHLFQRQTYMCTVSNPVSLQRVQRSITVSDVTSLNGEQAVIFHDTRIVLGPVARQSVLVGETLTLECITAGEVVSTVTWARNNSPLILGGRVSTAQAGRRLVVANVEPQDAGTYTCMGGDSVTASGDVEIIVPPAIATSFPAKTANASLSFSVTCSAVGTPPLTWRWLHNGLELAPSGGRTTYLEQGLTSTLIRTSLVEADSGVYQCVASQTATGRQATHHQVIDIRVVPPTHHTSPSHPDILALDGTDVTIPCLVTGFPPPTFSWVTLQSSDQSQPIPLQDARYSIPPAGTGNGSLTISQVTVADSSSLACIASNSPVPVQGARVILSVIAMPTILIRPPASLTPPAGTMVTLPCSAQPSTGITITYRWTRGNVIVGQESNFVIPAISNDQSDNGQYTCSLVVVKAGLDSAPLVIPVASTVVTVGGKGEPPSAPSSPILLPVSSITASSFTVAWMAPENNGGLPIRNYTLELLNRGSTFCPNTEPWGVVRNGIEPGVSSLLEMEVEDGIYSAMEYQVRVTAFTALFSTVSEPSQAFSTAGTVPGDPPTNLQVMMTSSTQLTLSWATPTSCLNYGGSFSGYRIRYSYRLQGNSFVTNDMDVPTTGGTGFQLTNLIPGTMYEVRVAARNAEGVGPAAVAMETTLPATPTPLAPPSLNATVINSSAVALSWEVPSSGADGILRYNVQYTRPDGTLASPDVQEGRLNLTITNLSPGTYAFRVNAVYQEGHGPADSATVTLEADVGESKGVVKQPWFYAVIGGAGTILVVLILILLLCICYQLCCRKDKVGGKYRGSFTVNTTSNHFSEYKRKGKNKNNTMPHVVVHTSPTPSRRSTDYAVPTLRTSHPIPPSTGPPSSAHPSTINLTSSAMSSPQFSARNALYRHSEGNPHDQQNGNAPMIQHENVPMERIHFHPYRDMTPSIHDLSFDDNASTPELERMDNHMTNAEHTRQVSASTSHKFVDTLSRVHTPPLSNGPQQFSHPSKSPQHHVPPPKEFPSSYLARASSQDIDEPPWNPGEMLNARGHMTNNPVGRSDSYRSTESSNSMEFRGPSQLAGDYRMPLSPLTEAHFIDGGGRSRAFTDGERSRDFREDVDGRSRDFTERSHDFREDVDGRLRDFKGRGSGSCDHMQRGNDRAHGYIEKDGRSYLTEVDVITSGLKGGQSSGKGGQSSWNGGQSSGKKSRRMREHMDMPLQGYRGHHGEGYRGHHGEGRMASYEPEVHVSYSKAVQQRPSSPTLSESGYAVPPSSKLAPSKPQSDTVYHCPPPAYAAPPPPDERDMSPPLSPRLASPIPPPHLQGLVPPHGVLGHPPQSSQGFPPPQGPPNDPQALVVSPPPQTTRGLSPAPPPTTSRSPFPLSTAPPSNLSGGFSPNKTPAPPNTSRGLTAFSRAPPPSSSRGLQTTRGLTALPPRTLSPPPPNTSHNLPDTSGSRLVHPMNPPPLNTSLSLSNTSHNLPNTRLQVRPLNPPARTSPPTTFSPPRTFSPPTMPPARHDQGATSPLNSHMMHPPTRQGATSPLNSHMMHPPARQGATSPLNSHMMPGAHPPTRQGATSPLKLNGHMVPGAHPPARQGAMSPHGVQTPRQRSASMESTSNSEVRCLHVIPMDGGVKPISHHGNTSSSDHSLNNSIDDSIDSEWSLDKIQRSMEQRANNFDSMLTPLQEGVETTPTPDHMTRGHIAAPTLDHMTKAPPPLKVVPVKAPKPPTLPKPQRPLPATKPHQRLPKATSPPPDIVPTNSGHHSYGSGHHSYGSGHHSHGSGHHSDSNGHHSDSNGSNGHHSDSNGHHSDGRNSSGQQSYSSDEEDPSSIAINKKRPKVPDLTTMDPRKPTIKVKKVPRSVWQPQPMTRAIQSSSSESDSDEGSDYSADTVVGPGDTSTLRSAHV